MMENRRLIFQSPGNGGFCCCLCGCCGGGPGRPPAEVQGRERKKRLI